MSLKRYRLFGLIAAIIIIAGGGSILAYYEHFLGNNSQTKAISAPSSENLKSSNSSGNKLGGVGSTTNKANSSRSSTSDLTLAVMGWMSSWEANPAIRNDEDVASLIVLMLENGSGGVVYKHANVGALSQQQLKSMGIIITPAFGWCYAGNTFSNITHPPVPISNEYFYNKVYQKVIIYYPEELKVAPGKLFGVILQYDHYKTGKKFPPPLDNMNFKFSLQKISKDEYKLWISIYANGTYIGKVPVLLKVVPPQLLVQKNRNKMRAQEIYKLNYKASLLKTYSWPAYNPMINNSEVRESLLVMVLYNGTINPSKVSYSIREMGIYATPGYGWGYCKSPKMGNVTFLSKEYQKVVVYYPKELKVTPGKAFGIIIRYLHLPTGKNLPKPLKKLTFQYSLQKVSGKEYELYVSICANGTYLGKIQITLELKP